MSKIPHIDSDWGRGEQTGWGQHHQALFYEGDKEYLDGLTRFIGPAVAAGEPVVAVLPAGRGRWLREQMNGSAEEVQILDMYEVGRNPARIMPAIEAILTVHRGAQLHYVGEPIWPGRSPEEICEATRHEALTNEAWSDVPIKVLCAYDAATLSPDVLADAQRTHPSVIRHGREAPSDVYGGATIPRRCDQPLPEPPSSARSMTFGADDIFKLRCLVTDVAEEAGLAADRITDLMLVSSELSTNTVRHGCGTGTLWAWSDPPDVICQVQDRGEIADPLAGRRRPVRMAVGGYGLWMVNQLCDLVEVRTSARGTTIRARVALA